MIGILCHTGTMYEVDAYDLAMGTSPNGLWHFGWCCVSKHIIMSCNISYLCGAPSDTGAACLLACVSACLCPAVATAARTPTSANCQPGCISLDFLAGLAGLESTCVCLTKTITDVQNGLRTTKQVRLMNASGEGCAVCWHVIWGPMSDQVLDVVDCLHACLSTAVVVSKGVLGLRDRTFCVLHCRLVTYVPS